MHYLLTRGLEEYELEVEATCTYAGCPAHYGSMSYPGHPAEAPEFEINEILFNGKPFAITQAEGDDLYDWIGENYEFD